MASGVYNSVAMLRAKRDHDVLWRGHNASTIMGTLRSYTRVTSTLCVMPASPSRMSPRYHLYAARGARMESRICSSCDGGGSTSPTSRFYESCHKIDSTAVSLRRAAWGHGLVTIAEGTGIVLDTWYPDPKLGSLPAGTDNGSDFVPIQFQELNLGKDPRRNVHVEVHLVEIDLDAPPTSTPDAYLRLHLLSHLLVLPNTLNLEGLFSHLPTVVWTSAGAVHPEDFPKLCLKLRQAGIATYGMDKFPRLLDYVTPRRVRIADAARVRLGAHLAPGTTVLHTGLVNFNADTLGASMVEDLIAQGVVVGVGSDVGAGASTIGTLSGGGTVRVTIGERSLIGANAGTGISLGDDCIVEAGLYVTRGTNVTVVDAQPPRVVKAIVLSGVPGLLFRRTSVTGTVEVVARDLHNKRFSLNAALHA